VGVLIIAGGAAIALTPWRASSIGPTVLQSSSTTVQGMVVRNLRVGAALDEREEVRPGSVVTTSTAQVFTGFDLAGVTVAIPVSARLVHVRTGEAWDSPSQLVDRDEHLVIAFKRGTFAWPSGRWRAEVLLNGFVAATQEYQVP
jgi:hypothetical protein